MLEWLFMFGVFYLVWRLFLRKEVLEFRQLKTEGTELNAKQEYHKQHNHLIDAINDRREEFFEAASRLGLGQALINERWSVVGNAHSDALRAAAEKKFACAHTLLSEAHRQAHALAAEVLGLIAEPAAEAVAC